MKQTPENVSGIYNGYQILLSIAVAIFVLAEIFTYTILAILRIITALLILAFIIGIIVSADKLKLAGGQKRKYWQRIFQIPICFMLLWLTVATIPVLLKSILAAAGVYLILMLIKPQSPVKQSNNP